MKSKDRASDDMNEEEEDVAAVLQQSEEDLEYEDPEANLPNAFRSAFS